MSRQKTVFVIACAVAWIGWMGLFAAFAQERMQTIEAVAEQIARNYNATKFADDITVSSTARAAKGNVIFTNVLRVQKGLPVAKLAEFKAALYADVMPQTCAANKEVFSWRKGLYYTFIYDNTYGERLAEFVVDERACGVK